MRIAVDEIFGWDNEGISVIRKAVSGFDESEGEAGCFADCRRVGILR